MTNEQMELLSNKADALLEQFHEIALKEKGFLITISLTVSNEQINTIGTGIVSAQGFKANSDDLVSIGMNALEMHQKNAGNIGLELAKKSLQTFTKEMQVFEPEKAPRKEPEPAG